MVSDAWNRIWKMFESHKHMHQKKERLVQESKLRLTLFSNPMLKRLINYISDKHPGLLIEYNYMYVTMLCDPPPGDYSDVWGLSLIVNDVVKHFSYITTSCRTCPRG